MTVMKSPYNQGVDLNERGLFMGLIDRIILTIYSFVLTILSIILLLVSLNIVNFDFLRTTLEDALQRREMIAVTLVFLLVSLRFLFSGFRRNKPRHAITSENKMGQIKISLKAIENCIIKAAKEVEGVKNISASIKRVNEGINVTINIKVLPDMNIPETAKSIQERVKTHVENNVGTQINEIKIFVENISGTEKPRVT